MLVVCYFHRAVTAVSGLKQGATESYTVHPNARKTDERPFSGSFTSSWSDLETGVHRLDNGVNRAYTASNPIPVGPGKADQCGVQH